MPPRAKADCCTLIGSDNVALGRDRQEQLSAQRLEQRIRHSGKEMDAKGFKIRNERFWVDHVKSCRVSVSIFRRSTCIACRPPSRGHFQEWCERFDTWRGKRRATGGSHKSQC